MKPGSAERNTVIRVSRRYGSPPDRVFYAWLDPEVAGKWLFATASRPMARVAIDARVKGSFCLVERHDGEGVEYRGVYVEITSPRRLVFTLSVENSRDISRVTVELAPVETGCDLVLTHENVPADHASRTEARWTGILYGLGVTLESSFGGRTRADGDLLRMGPLSNSGCADRQQGTTTTIDHQETLQCDSPGAGDVRLSSRCPKGRGRVSRDAGASRKAQGVTASSNAAP